MLKQLADNWWSFAMRGVFALLFGTLALSFPEVTLLALILMFGLWALIDGVTALIMAIGEKGWFWYLLAGILSAGVGLFALARPGATGLALLWLIGIWAVVKGFVEIMEAIQLRKEIEGEWALILTGAISILFGIIVLARPGAGALALVWLIAVYAYLFGVLQLMIGFRLRRLKKSMESESVPAM
mgnify:FL=1